MISYSDKTSNTFTGIKRGVNGTLVADHYRGQQVTNTAYFFQVKAHTNLAGDTPAHFGVVRIDLTPPSAPLGVLPGPAKSGKPEESGKYDLQWNSARDFESGVQMYEIQERMDTNPVWKDINFVSGDRFSDNIGDGIAADINGKPVADLPRAKDHFYYYRIRAMNYAGSWGPWSVESAPAPTGVPSEVISSVSNFPNPVDTRKGGEEGKTSIVYILNQNADVTITLYDLLGYSVYSWSFSAGSPGGAIGSNRILWDGTNGTGAKVAKGGYIAQIRPRRSNRNPQNRHYSLIINLEKLGNSATIFMRRKTGSKKTLDEIMDFCNSISGGVHLILLLTTKANLAKAGGAKPRGLR
jgi:hypothetical protein